MPEIDKVVGISRKGRPKNKLPKLNDNWQLSSIYVFSYFPFGFEGRIWDLIVSVPDHCLSFYFSQTLQRSTGNQRKKYGSINPGNMHR